MRCAVIPACDVQRANCLLDAGVSFVFDEVLCDLYAYMFVLYVGIIVSRVCLLWKAVLDTLSPFILNVIKLMSLMFLMSLN